MGLLDSIRSGGEKVDEWFKGPSGSSGGETDVPGKRLDEVGGGSGGSLVPELKGDLPTPGLSWGDGSKSDGSSKPDGSGDSEDVRVPEVFSTDIGGSVDYTGGQTKVPDQNADQTQSADPNQGTELGKAGDDYYGQSTLEQRDSPTIGNPLEGEGSDFGGEGSWMDFDKSEDGVAPRYDRDTGWGVDAALTFDTETVDELTVPDMGFTEEEQAAFSEPLQDVVTDNTPDPTDDGSDTTETGQDDHNRTRPQPGGGDRSKTPGPRPDVVSGSGPTGGGSSSAGTWQSRADTQDGGEGGTSLWVIGGALAAVGGGAYYYYYMM